MGVSLGNVSNLNDISTNRWYLKINWKNESKKQYVTNLLMSVYFMSCHGFRNNNAMFKPGEAQDVERVAYTFSLLMCQSKRPFLNLKKKQAEKINRGHVWKIRRILEQVYSGKRVYRF